MKLFFTVCAFLIIGFIVLYFYITVPGKSYRGSFLPLSEHEVQIASQLHTHIDMLATQIGERRIGRPEGLAKSAAYIKTTLENFGYTPLVQSFIVDNTVCENISIEIKGQKTPQEIILFGAHYDTAPPASFGANDNGSGVAALLVMAQHFANHSFDKTLRFVFFVNEEAPFFYTQHMGSLRYAQEAKKNKENIQAMFCLETIGYYSEEPASQYYPFPLSCFYPDKGNFIGFISNFSSREILVKAIKVFRATTQFPSEGAALPSFIEGVAWSDHWSFWHEGYKAIMITDTAFDRYPYYHTNQDTADKVDYNRLARVVQGIEQIALFFTKERN